MLRMFTDITEAKAEHELIGGYLLDFGGTYFVTDDNPAEHRSFNSYREAIDYAFQMAEANYDETEMIV